MYNYDADGDDRLAEILESHPESAGAGMAVPMETKGTSPVGEAADPSNASGPRKEGQSIQWTLINDLTYVPAGKTAAHLRPGVYEIGSSSSIGLYFQRIPIKTEGLIRFPQTNSDLVIEEIQKFWDRETLFKEYDLAYKRGIMLWGPPGSGKSSTIQIITQDVVEREGIVVKFLSPELFVAGMRKLREIQPDTPVVALMEDIDSTLQRHSETEVLNILDGIDQVRKIVFLATTNYPERLGERIMNRPSRFDKRFYIGHPDADSRRLYFENLIKGREVPELEMDRWVRDTENFSIAHLKELFIAVVILGDSYEDALKTLSKMSRGVSSTDNGSSIGLRAKSNSMVEKTRA